MLQQEVDYLTAENRLLREKLGSRHLRHAISEYMAHYHRERNHQGLGNALIDGEQQDVAGAGRIVRRERLGGLLSFYLRKTAVRERTEYWDRTGSPAPTTDQMDWTGTSLRSHVRQQAVRAAAPSALAYRSKPVRLCTAGGQVLPCAVFRPARARDSREPLPVKMAVRLDVAS